MALIVTEYRIRVPSGDHSSSETSFGSCVTWLETPVVRSITKMLRFVDRPNPWYASVVPSGESAGSDAPYVSWVTWRGFVPFWSRRKICERPRMLPATASADPSRDALNQNACRG